MALAITLARYVFICIWNSIRTMNDDLLVRIVIVEVIFLSCYFSSIGPPLRKTQNLALCTGNFNEVNNDDESEWHGTHFYYSLIFGICLTTTIILMAIIQLKRHQISQVPYTAYIYIYTLQM